VLKINLTVQWLNKTKSRLDAQQLSKYHAIENLPFFCKGLMMIMSGRTPPKGAAGRIVSAGRANISD